LFIWSNAKSKSGERDREGRREVKRGEKSKDVE
jgi:hypothetical protein